MQRISLACGWIVKGDLLDGWVIAMVGGEDSRREPKLGKLFQMGKAISNRIVGGFDDAALQKSKTNCWHSNCTGENELSCEIIWGMFY